MEQLIATIEKGQPFFNAMGVTAEEFMGRLEAYLVYYREERIKKSLGWLSPMEYRRKLGYA